MGSLVCALSDSLVPVLAGRGLQGLAMGFIPVGISLMREVVPPDDGRPPRRCDERDPRRRRRDRPAAVGLDRQSGDWHALFWVATGLAVLVTRLRRSSCRTCTTGTTGTFDVVGALGLAVGLVALLVGISKGNTWGWGSAHARLHRRRRRRPAGLGLVRAAPDEPLCDLRVTAQPPGAAHQLAAVAIGFGMMAQAIVFPQLLQLPEETGYGLGQSLLAAGLWMAPGGLMMLAVRAGLQLPHARASARSTPSCSAPPCSASATCSRSS